MDPTRTETNPEFILGTLDKGLRVLDAIASADSPDGLTLTELARRLEMHRTTLFRLLATLRARGYVDRDPRTERYRLGIKLLALATTLLSQLDVRQVARPTLTALRDQTQELVLLTILDDIDVVTVERVEGRQSLSLQTDIGARRPIYCSASGKAILAYLPPADVDRILALGMPPVTPNTITDSSDMQRHLDEVRRRGYSWDDEERIPGVRCVAAPVFAHDRAAIGAVSIAAPAMRMPWDRLWQMGEEVRATAETISRSLGYTGRDSDLEAG